jgi:hypothetical protein
MNTTFFTARAMSREHDLREDLGAAELAQQAVTARHAEAAADCAAHLRGHAQAVAWQQHALDGLAIGQVDQQSRRSVLAWMFRAHLCERIELGLQGRQRGFQRTRQLVGRDPAPHRRQRLTHQPAAQHALRMQRPGAVGEQAFADRFEVHGTWKCRPDEGPR